MMTESSSDLIALLILSGFSDYRTQFQRITAGAQGDFEAANWSGIQQSAAQRIDLYETMAVEAADKVRAAVGEQVNDHNIWVRARSYYLKLASERNDVELAETFYNSIYCRLLGHHQIDNKHMFIRSALETREIVSGDEIYRSYPMEFGLIDLLRKMLDDFSFNIPWEHRRRDIRNLVRYIHANYPDNLVAAEDTVIEVIKSVFYRNKGAYLVGRVHFGDSAIPFVLPVLNNEQGAVYIDTAISQENDVSIIFSFTRAYFMVDVNAPSEFIRFLHSLIPMKSQAELYNSIGFYKQGKADFYRSFVDHLELSNDRFEIAPGTKGMVMTVFTLPSYPVVFKIIKDSFSSTKQITRTGVIEKYQLVKRHDRAGRMADTQEFVNLSLPRSRFSESALAELQKDAASSLKVNDAEILIGHLWIERRMTPLNLYLDDALLRDDEDAIFHAVNEFGKCIKELAAANIFAGDMLFKNFGVTRHGRVVFYDYDEILYLTECYFRPIPEALYPEQEMASEPWYSVAPNDVFPEEFSLLTACNRKIRKVFNGLHGDLLDYRWWQNMQQQVRGGEVVDLFPYRKARRFPRA
ncbi:bifunctional isocitrate dehydrogenase kinase/phosphatase [Amphritea sp. HPY]|uniref:bifunctional isocitrate dehydrogenase kinase/phosphatase n=1 Tax=Amphritea sp. HPY TaxID=3421652 RepID=UPI003D7E8075